MSHSIQTVAAAIATIADGMITEQGLDINDTDAMALVMKEAEGLVANELVRQGMSLREAQELAGEAVIMPGREDANSVALAEAAYRNRHASVPTETRTAPNAEGAEPPETVAAEDGSSPISDEEKNRQRVAASDRTVAAEQRPQRRSREDDNERRNVRERIPYRILMKKVHEVFRGVARDPLFDFEVPVIDWDRPHPGVPRLDPAYNMDLEHLHTMLYAIAAKRSTNLVGPHGCGKTQFVNQVAARLNFPVTVLPMDGQLTRRELIGQEKLRATENGNESYFAAGLLPQAMEEPGFILFDEVDRGVSDLQYACHSVYLQEGLTILEDSGRFIPFHEYNRVFGTSNTKGRGSLDGMYLASEEMSEATRDRWSLWIEMDYQSEDEDIDVLLAKAPGLRREHAEIIANISGQIRAAYKGGQIAQTISMRQQLEVAHLTAFLTRSETDAQRVEKMLRAAFDRVVLGRASEADKGAIETMLTAKIPNAFTGNPIF